MLRKKILSVDFIIRFVNLAMCDQSRVELKFTIHTRALCLRARSRRELVPRIYLCIRMRYRLLYRIVYKLERVAESWVFTKYMDGFNGIERPKVR